MIDQIGLGWALNLATDVLMGGEWGKTHREGEDRGRYWSDESISQGTPSAVCGHWELEETQGMDSLSEPPEGTYPADTLILDSRLPEL